MDFGNCHLSFCNCVRNPDAVRCEMQEGRMQLTMICQIITLA